MQYNNKNLASQQAFLSLLLNSVCAVMVDQFRLLSHRHNNSIFI